VGGPGGREPREGYGGWERKGRGVGVLKGREAGEIGGNYATLHNISQSKKGEREQAKKKRGGGRDWKVHLHPNAYGTREFLKKRYRVMELKIGLPNSQRQTLHTYKRWTLQF